MYTEMGVSEPYRVCVVVDKVGKKKTTDPETNLDRIEWFFNNSVPPRNGMIVSFYENENLTYNVWSPFSSSYNWPLKERWCGMGDYITFQKIEDGCSEKNRRIATPLQNELINYLEQTGTEVKYVNYETPIEELYDLLIDCKFHISYAGSTYCVAPSMGVPVLAYGYNADHGRYHEDGSEVTMFGGKAVNKILTYNQFTNTSTNTFSTTIKNLGRSPDIIVENLKKHQKKFGI